MRINHNIAALNTYRQLNANGTNTNKSLEKLSSGLRINRAGDDAAGLAISEKMRAQIRGLDQAGRNAQDSISMIQTAEGALNETQSILQRMRELSVQASNDTNTESDRGEIQKELNQLTSEVNRIGNTTEFNTKKLLNGGDGKTGNIRYSILKTGDPATGSAAGTVSALNVATQSIKAGTVEVGNFAKVTDSKLAANAGDIGSPLTQVTASIAGGTGAISGDVAVVSTAGIAPTGNIGAANISAITQEAVAAAAQFTVDFASAVNGLQSGDGIQFGDVMFTAGTAAEVAAGNADFAIGASDAATIANLATLLNGSADIDTAGNAGVTVAVTAPGATTVTFTAGAVNDAIQFGTQAVDLSSAANAAPSIDIGATAAVYTFEITDQFTAGDQLQIGGETFTAVANGVAAGANQFELGTDIAGTVTNLVTALNGDASISADYVASAGSPDWTGDTTNSITIKNKVAGVDANAADYSTNVGVTQTTAQEGVYKFEIASNFEAGQKIKVGDQEFVARASGVSDATGFVIGADINATATNLLAAINANGTLSGQFEAAVLKDGNAGGGGTIAASNNATDADTIVLKELTASGSTMAALLPGGVTAIDQAAVKGVYSFEFSQNFSRGDSVTIGSKSYVAGTAADVLAGTAQFEIGNTIDASVTKLVAKIDADGIYDAAKGDSTFYTGNKITLTEASASGTDLVGGDITRTKATAQAGKFEFLLTNNMADRDRIVIDGRALMAGTDFQVGADANATAANLRTAIAADAVLKDKYTVGADSDNKITLTEKAGAVDGVNLTTPTISAGAIAGQFKFSTGALTAGSSITIDAEKLTLVSGGSEAQTATELKSLIENNTALNAKYSVTVSGADLSLTQKAGQESASSPTLSYEIQAGSGFSALSQIGANSGQSMSVDINDMRSLALGISSTSGATGQTVEVDGKQYAVAWTSNTAVTNGTDNVSSEYALDVSNNDNATAAVKIVDDAINSVSAERSKLGAFQNRLEHTINNLGTSSENLTAAESRIRDVDMAKEMMEFTKNNILSQAAQAMLAQANQQPQGVLQLLR